MDLLYILSFRLAKTKFKDTINILQTGPMFWTLFRSRCLEVNKTLILFTSDYQQTGEQLLHGLGLVSERAVQSHLKGPLLVP